MQTLTVISGKGGTGKTSVLASFVALAGKAVIADCDVDAADLHLVLEPKAEKEEEFFSSRVARVDEELCTGCGRCADLCRFQAIEMSKGSEIYARVKEPSCEGCGVCERFCPAVAIHMEDRRTGLLLQASTRFGPLVHARLDAGGENSGKLVTEVRRRASSLAKQQGYELILVDGSPGVGCPVMASLTASDLVLIVSEASLSALHDLERVLQLLEQFRLPAMLCLNRHDQNPQVAERILTFAHQQKLKLAGRVRQDRAVVEAQIEGKPVVQFTKEGATEDIRNVWDRVSHELDSMRRESKK